MYKYFQQNFPLPYIMMNSRLSYLMVIQCTMQTLFAWSVILWRRKYEKSSEFLLTIYFNIIGLV